MRKKIVSMFLLMMLTVTVFSGCTTQISEEEIQDMVDESLRQWEMDWPFYSMSMNYSEIIGNHTSNATFHLDVAEFLLSDGKYINATIELSLANDSRNTAFDELDAFKRWYYSLENDVNASEHVISQIADDYIDQSNKLIKVSREIDHYFKIVDYIYKVLE